MVKIKKVSMILMGTLFLLCSSVYADQTVNSKADSVHDDLNADLKDSGKINKKTQKHKNDTNIIGTMPGLKFYEAWKIMGKDLAKILSEQPAVKPILNQNGYMTSLLYVRTGKDVYSLFLGFSQGSVVHYKFKDPEFKDIQSAEIVLNKKPNIKPAVTALAYAEKSNSVFAGYGNQTITGKTKFEPMELLNLTIQFKTNQHSIGAEIKSVSLENGKIRTVRAASAHNTTVDYLRAIVAPDGKDYILCTFGPQQLPQTLHAGLQFGGDMTAGDLPISPTMSGGDVEFSNEYFQQMFLIKASDIPISFTDNMIRESWGRGQNCYAIGSAAEKIAFVGFKDGTIRSYNVLENDWDLLQGLGWGSSVNVLLYSKSKISPYKEHLIAGLDNGTVQLYDFSTKNWKTIQGHGWGNNCAIGQIYTDKDENYALIGLANGAIFMFDLNNKDKGFFQIEGHDRGCVSAISNIVKADNDNLLFVAGNETGVLTKYLVNPKNRSVSSKQELKGRLSYHPMKYASGDATPKHFNIGPDGDSVGPGWSKQPFCYANKLNITPDLKTVYISNALSAVNSGIGGSLNIGGGIYAFDFQTNAWTRIAPNLIFGSSTPPHPGD